jgi:hypothetical protein
MPVGNWHVVDVAALKFALSHARLDLLVTAALLSVLSQWANPRLFGESMVDLRAVITGSRKLRRDDIITPEARETLNLIATYVLTHLHPTKRQEEAIEAATGVTRKKLQTP